MTDNNFGYSNQILDENQIEKMVSDVYIDANIIDIPVKLSSVIQHYGFKLYRAELPNEESGLIIVSDEIVEKYNSNKVIIVNSKHSVRRRRFTVAHELAHYIFHQNENIFAHRDDGNQHDFEEKNANSFASAFLMPKKDVIRKVKEFRNNYCREVSDSVLISSIADEFNVSKAAAKVRLMKLEVI